MPGHGDHLEHAIHHGSTDYFEKTVAMTIAIIAAVLAGVTTLSHRGHTETIRLQAEANVYRTQESDYWNLYQAHNIRKHVYEEQLELATFMAKTPGSAEAEQRAKERWQKQVEGYRKELPEDKAKAEEFKRLAEEKTAESHRMHARVDRYDLGELGIELGLVLCSVSVLTRQRGFWLSGIVSCIIGIVVAMTGWLELFLSAGHH